MLPNAFNENQLLSFINPNSIILFFLDRISELFSPALISSEIRGSCLKTPIWSARIVQ